MHEYSAHGTNGFYTADYPLQMQAFQAEDELNVGPLESAAELYDSYLGFLQTLPVGVMSFRHFLYLSSLTLSKCPDFTNNLTVTNSQKQSDTISYQKLAHKHTEKSTMYKTELQQSM